MCPLVTETGPNVSSRYSYRGGLNVSSYYSYSPNVLTSLFGPIANIRHIEQA